MNVTEGRQFAETVDAYRMEAAGTGMVTMPEAVSGGMSGVVVPPPPNQPPVAVETEDDPLVLLAGLRRLRDAGRLSPHAYGLVAAELSQI